MTGTAPTPVNSQHHEKVANEKGEHILQMVYLMRGYSLNYIRFHSIQWNENK